METHDLTRNRSMQFSLRALLAGVLCAAVVSLFVSRYIERRVDFVDPPDYSSRKPLTQSEVNILTKGIMKGHAAYVAELQQDHPPRGIEYWHQQAEKVEPGMTTYALFKYVPAASSSGSILTS